MLLLAVLFEGLIVQLDAVDLQVVQVVVLYGWLLGEDEASLLLDVQGTLLVDELWVVVEAEGAQAVDLLRN